MTNMKKKSVFIVEDNIHQLEEVKRCVASHPSLILSGYSRNGKEALEKLRTGSVDLLLLDINLPECSGVELLESLENPPYVVFITAYDDYAIKAFELGAIDYILKPLTNDRFNMSIKRFLSNSEKTIPLQKPLRELGISFKGQGGNFFISYDDIVYLTASGKATIVHTVDKDFDASCLMKDFESRLSSGRFVRVHRKYLVNTSFLSHARSKHNNFILYLKDDDDTQIPVGKSYQKEIKQLLLNSKVK